MKTKPAITCYPLVEGKLNKGEAAQVGNRHPDETAIEFLQGTISPHIYKIGAKSELINYTQVYELDYGTHKEFWVSPDDHWSAKEPEVDEPDPDTQPGGPDYDY